MNRIIGIGIDIEEIRRFKSFSKNSAIVKKIFTEQEISYCFAKADPSSHLASRFCAKEATIKALGKTGLNLKDLKKIEITVDRENVPTIRILNKRIKKFKFFVSLSHSQDLAIASVTACF